VVDYAYNLAAKHGDDILQKMSFEVTDMASDIRRVYDITFTNPITQKVIKLELKNWSRFFPSTIKDQFIKDLKKIASLEELKWVFNKTGGMPDIGTLKTKVMKALKKADGSAVDELGSIPIEKIKKLFGSNVNGIDELNKAEKLLEVLNNDEVFEKIFEVVN